MRPDETSRPSARPRPSRNRSVVAGGSLLLIGLFVGLVAGVFYAWMVAPVSTAEVTMADLAPTYQREYIRMASQAYAADGDWPRTEARLAALQLPNLPAVVLAELEEALREGAPALQVRDLAQMAERLGAQGGALALFAPTAEPSAPTTSEAEPTAATAEAVPTLLPTPTPNAPATATLPPTITPSPTPPATPTPRPTYRLLGQQQVCRANAAVPLLEVTVVDGLLDELPAVEIIVSWEGDTDRFLTGFKPGKGLGYGDFEMEVGLSYAVALGGEGTAASAVGGLRAEPCQTGTGWQNWVLRFQYLGE